MDAAFSDNAITHQLAESARRTKNWQRWGTYLPDRQWGTVREDYSPQGDTWNYLPHDHARSRVFRWGEDGLLGWTDRECRLCFAFAFWNGKDPILKERLFGLTNAEGNHGEDVKECYYHLDATPTYSYAKALYKYPQAAFPYDDLVRENARRSRQDPEYELTDTGIFNENRYFDLVIEYAKGSDPDDTLIRLTATNRGPDTAPLHVLPTLWYRNTWSWGRIGEGYWARPQLRLDETTGVIHGQHESLGSTCFFSTDLHPSVPLFTDNETNTQRLYGVPNGSPYVKDAFHEYLVQGQHHAVNPAHTGTKFARHYTLDILPGESITLNFRLYPEGTPNTASLGPDFEHIFANRQRECAEFYETKPCVQHSAPHKRLARDIYAGLLWTKQYYQYGVNEWIQGDPANPRTELEREMARNKEWEHLYNRDIISVCDKWEYPWYASWDHAFAMIPFTDIDPNFAKEQMVLFLREWYMHPNGQLPAYEFELSDVNPPVQAWAARLLYRNEKLDGRTDRAFLERIFVKLLLNFTWWVNRKDAQGNNLFQGGFLGLDNIGVFDRSKPLPGGGILEQADGTAWMAFYCIKMLAMSLELARENRVYEDMASKFFEHFVAIADAMNTLGGSGLWDEEDGFYYDRLKLGNETLPIKVRSIVGIIPLFAVEECHSGEMMGLPEFSKRLQWFLNNRADLAHETSYMVKHDDKSRIHRLLALPCRGRLERVLRYVLDENEFLSPYGIRSLSKVHEKHPFVFSVDGQEYKVGYVPGESNTGLFGGNSNWRGPIWLPINYLLIESLLRYHSFYGESFKVECPTGSGNWMTLNCVAKELAQRLLKLFLPDENGRRPCHGDDPRYANDPHWRDLPLFHEYFHGDSGRGCGASHQTGWTALIAHCLKIVEEKD